MGRGTRIKAPRLSPLVTQICLGMFPPGRYLWLGTHFPFPDCVISPVPPFPDLRRHRPHPA